MLKTILVDDERPALKALKRVLSYYPNIEIIGEYTDIFEAIEKVKNHSIDLIFLDINMPKLNGIEAANKIFKISDSIEIIFVTAYNDYAVDAFEVNAVDYIMKPVSRKRLDKAIEKIMKKHSITKKIDKLILQANTDSLTGLYNRRYVIEKIENLMKCKNSEKNSSFVISDIDLFKKINDIYGHNCGDFVLKLISKIILETIRKEDLLARWGGEEFIILLPETDLEKAKIIAERIRKKVENYVIHYSNFEFSITMTFGIALYDRNKEIKEIIDNADKALYEGKAKGRNCVVVYGDN